ncbi:YafY family protein [Paenibacillus campi]|uniref:helix-turn-helix transcriptional regulator n=1 Tax=Paenibacillus campi TaxID=3106031 RepID=UPI002AFE58C6|nr:YafY family protein [Paenibacillus sp. SGZ-1009]
MNKAERLQQMQRYVHRQRRFTLGELMAQFSISRRTAIRDVEALEAIGVPLYAEHGRYGGYRLLDTATLPPVSFTAQEVLALYFSMQALESLSGAAFGVSFASINAKFLDIVSPQQQQQIEQFRNRVAFYYGIEAEPGACLEQLLLAAADQRIVRIGYRSGERVSQRRIQPFAIYVMDGYWYCRSYDMDKRQYRVFRCDRIESIVRTDEPSETIFTHVDLHTALTLRQPSQQAISFRCQLPELTDEKRLEARLPPSLHLEHKDGVWQLYGCYEPEEIDFMLAYLAGLGTVVSAVEPLQLKQQLQAYYRKLLERL